MAKKKAADSNESSQPEVNIGLVGHVDHGKTTLTEQLSGKWTDTHSQEIKRGITIRLGYADSIFRKCPKCKDSEAYTSKPECPEHKVATEVIRKVSFVDAPGHESLMATMLSGATIIDGALLLVAANESCPQPQTREHLMALQICGIKNIIIVQNKIDLVATERALRNHQQIKEFLSGTEYENAPIIPISAQHGVNIGALIQAIEEFIPTPKRNEQEEPLMFLARSFDVNKPGTEPKNMKGGVLGGALIKGKLKVGDRIEIRPGHVVEEQNRKVGKPIFSKVLSIVTGGQAVEEAIPGGSIGVMTTLDPSIVMADSLVGNIVGLPEKLPKIWYELDLETHLLERVVGAEQELKVDPVKMNEPFMLNVNAAATVGFVTDISKNRLKCKLKLPICADPGARVTISRRIGNRFRLIGYGMIKG
ncbi:MAG TPA: translation initiation factor IF-2 subunit gamma [Candidatus Nanoarchaeia archaeon]|nr:translation initiation factor IF-2 subunit gamma [Candidatus Nanoarchaeia archaeon]